MKKYSANTFNGQQQPAASGPRESFHWMEKPKAQPKSKPTKASSKRNL